MNYIHRVYFTNFYSYKFCFKEKDIEVVMKISKQRTVLIVLCFICMHAPTAYTSLIFVNRNMENTVLFIQIWLNGNFS